ncbi:MAG: prepilin-type N-terminal cleavage/methylation domain-containing protein, partial [Leptospirales bacterium]|nr:prepilin-type N-terminal cleavage/methylation domain-containing protein [Leptospirales bacterium]
MKKSALGRIRNRRGMTLIELSIVIVVLGIIIGLVTYGLRTAGAGAQDGANKLKIQSQETMLKMQWQNYENEFGSLATGDNL